MRITSSYRTFVTSRAEQLANIGMKARLDLAAGISRATVKRLRNGGGQISSLRKALEASLLDLKNLPPGPLGVHASLP